MENFIRRQICAKAAEDRDDKDEDEGEEAHSPNDPLRARAKGIDESE